MFKIGSVIALTVLLFWSCGRPFEYQPSVGLRSITDPNGGEVTEVAPNESTLTKDALVFGDRDWIYYLAPNSKSPRKLVKGNFPALAPDGRRIVYVEPNDPDESVPAAGSLMLYDLTTGQAANLHRAQAWLANPRWSPVDELILFTQTSAIGSRDLYTIWPDGKGLTRLVTSGEKGFKDIFNPVWAPDGETIFFQDMGNLVQVSMEGRAIADYPLDWFTGNAQVVTSSDAYVPNPVDSDLLAFTKSVPGTPLFEKTFGEPNTGLFIYNWMTKTSQRMTPDDILALDPVWSRDGKYLYFSGYRDIDGKASYPFKIYRIGREGSGLTVIASGENPQT